MKSSQILVLLIGGMYVYASTQAALDAFTGYWPKFRIWLFWNTLVAYYRFFAKPRGLTCVDTSIFSADKTIRSTWSIRDWEGGTDAPISVWLIGGKISDYPFAFSACSELYLVCVECDRAIDPMHSKIHIITTTSNMRSYCDLYNTDRTRCEVASVTVMIGHTKASLTATLVRDSRLRLENKPGLFDEIQKPHPV